MVEGFYSWETVKVLFYNSNAEEDLNVMVEKTGHLFQTDVLSLAHLNLRCGQKEIQVLRWWKCTS